MMAWHYGFAGEEVEFSPSTMVSAGINYDIKYRMGGESEAEEE